MREESLERATDVNLRRAAPRWLRDAPVSALAPMGKVPGFLADAGISSIGEVMEKSDGELRAIHGLGRASVDRLRRRLRLLARLKEGRPHTHASNGARKVPGVPSAVLDALLKAETVRQEMEALAAGLPSRNASLFLARLGVDGEPRPNLEDLGAKWGISRERVRQVVEHRSRLLAASGIHLPLAMRLAELLDREGGLATTPELLEMARAHGIRADGRILHSYRHVHEIGLVPLVDHLPDVDSWVTERGTRKWIESGILAEHLERVRRIGYTFFRRIGCVEGCRLADGCLLTRRQRTCALVSRYGRMDEVEGYLVPDPAISSKLTRSVLKMLAVAPRLSVEDIAEGLARLRRELRVIPPVSVIEHILARHAAFEVREGTVRVARALAEGDPLSKAERAFVSLLDGKGGLVAYRTLLEGMEAEGFSRHTAAVLMARSPFLRRADVGLYATMGGSLPRKRFLEQHANGRDRNEKP